MSDTNREAHRLTFREAPRLLWGTLYKFFGDDCPGMAAALTFYIFFSLPALLALLLSLVGMVADPAEVQRGITTQVGGLIGRAGADQVQTIIQNARRTVGDQSLAAVLGVLAVIFGATTAFAQLQGALNKAWGVKPDPRRNQLRDFLAKRVFSFGVVLAVAFLLLVSLALSAALSAAGGVLTARLGAPTGVLAAINWVVSFVVIAALFAAMYKLLPDARIAWRDVRLGAVATALLFVLGKSAIGFYLGRTDPGSAYGAAGSLAIVLIWVYYSSMLLLFGAELTRMWAERYGSGVRPEHGAVEVVEKEVEVQRG
jgi:membrane protein